MRLFVGDIVSGRVIKALPDADAYLLWVQDVELYALLPKNQALQQYRVGDTLLAAVMQIKGARITLSQLIPQFLRRLLEMEFADVLSEKNWMVKRAVMKPPIGKVLIASLNGDSYETINSLLNAATRESNLLKRYYDKCRIYFIPKIRGDKLAQIAEALRPAPIEKIDSITLLSGEANVCVPAELVGLFVGKKGLNVLTASRLLGLRISIISSNTS